MRLAVLVLLIACGGPQITEHRTDVVKFLPATLESDRPQKGDPRTAHVRVYVDAAVRATPHWKEDITDQIDYAGQLLTPMLGVRVVVDSIKEWDRSGDPHEAMASLTALDPAKDITWVIGYVAPDDKSSKVMSQLADSVPLGHHIVIHAWNDTKAIEAKLPDVKQQQRTELVAAHRRHKQTVVLLHALAATLGAIAEADPSWIQHPTYSPKQSTFSDRNRELMQMAIDDRLSGGTDQTVAKKLLEAIEKTNWGGWLPGDHDDVVSKLRNVVDSNRAGKTAADVPAAAYDQFNRIRELAKRGAQEIATPAKVDPKKPPPKGPPPAAKPNQTIKDALIELDNLLAAYPGNASMHILKCEILIIQPGIADPATRTACAHVSDLAPGDPSAHFLVAEALLRAKDLPGARGELEKAEAKIGNLPTGGADAWRRLIGIYAAMGALTWTENALDKANLPNDPAAQLVAQTRARYGVPKGWKVKPEDEGALVAAVRGALDLVYANKFGDAERAIEQAERKWPNTPGLLAVRCDLSFRQGSVDGARAACNRAVAEDPDESWALYLGGVIALRDTSASGTQQGIAKLKHAIEKDPDLGQAWRALAKAYARAKDQAAYDQLNKDYQAKFQQALPPP
jgi:tetratricopeptide (TPR) repeat protein